ncbi:MAG: hypothetical protein D6705_13055 [Deltaproteobacteria bacterium]|nr:MAG: hypothetical protein D6705_13055 [Deltaproteobacteria bacterium]
MYPIAGGNHNTYLLRGLAAAGYGHLREDWLVRTPDPTPIFSALVAAAWSATGRFGLIAMGVSAAAVYLWALYRLACPQSSSRPRSAQAWSCVLLLGLLHARLVRGVFAAAGIPWIRALTSGVAEQALLAHALQPALFGVLLVAALVHLRDGRHRTGMLHAVGAATVHPTYLWASASLAGAGLLLEARRRGIRRALVTATIGLITVTPIVVYVVANFVDTDPATAETAARILARERIPHHALPSRWFGAVAVVQVGLVVLATAIVRDRATKTLFGVPMVLAVVVSSIVAVTGSNRLALVFPWRSSTVLVPAATACLIGTIVRVTFERAPSLARHMLRVLWLAFLASVVYGATAMGRPAHWADDDAEAVYAHARASATAGQLWWIPEHFERFRLATGLPAWVDRKSHPYDPESVLEWRRRIEATRRLARGTADCAEIRDIVRRSGITHVVTSVRSRSTRRCLVGRSTFTGPRYVVRRVGPPR